MKIWKSVILMLCMSIVLVGCRTATEMDHEEKALTIEDGVLKVGAHIGYAPMEYYEEGSDVPVGFDMELAQALARELGLQLEIVDCAWDAIFVNVENRSFDVIISGVSYTKQRSEVHTLTQAYVENGLALVVPKDSKVKDFDEFEGKNVGVQLETTADAYIKSLKEEGKNITLSQYENVANAFDALENDQIDGVYADSVVANYYIVQNPDYKIVWESDEAEPICMCLAKDNTRLKDEIEGALLRLERNGKLEELSIKYFGTDLTMKIEE